MIHVYSLAFNNFRFSQLFPDESFIFFNEILKTFTEPGYRIYCERGVNVV